MCFVTGSSRTLPKPPKPKLVGLGSGTSATASSRKSSNTSSNSSHSCSGCSSCCGENEKYEISQEALNEIAAFGTFLEQFHERQQSQSQTSSKTSPTSTTSSSTNISHKPPIQHRKANNSKTLERQQKIQDNWMKKNEEEKTNKLNHYSWNFMSFHYSTL